MALPSDQKQIVDSILSKYCATRVPIHVRDRLNMGYREEGNAVILFEQRPTWKDKSKWMMCDVAKFRYVIKEGKWHLYCRNRYSEWVHFDPMEPVEKFEQALREVDVDTTGIFWG